MKTSRFLRLRRVLPRAAWMVAVALCVIASVRPSFAQVSRASAVNVLGSMQQIGAPGIKGTDTAYDPVNKVYLVINAYIPSVAWFVNTNGAPVTAAFDIARGGGGFHFPRARYSPHVNNGQGGFMVTYMEEGPSNVNVVHARVVTYPGVLGPDNIISDAGSPAWLESGAALAYSPASQRFLVAWRGSAINPHPSARLIGLTGAGVGSVITLSTGFGRDTAVAWNSATNEFGVSFAAENAAGSAGFLSFAVVSPATGNFTRQSFNAIAGFTYITDLDYNPDTGRYVMTWHEKPGGQSTVKSAEIDAAGNVVSSGLVSTELPGYDALGLAFNPISRTFLLTSIRSVTDRIDEIVAAELNTRGVRTSVVTSIVPPSLVSGILGRYPRVASATDSPRWNISYSNALVTVNDVIVSTTSTNGGPSTAPTGGGGGTTTCSTPQPGVGWTCVNGSWIPPSGGGGSTGSCTTVRPGADWTCVNGSWLPPGSGGGSPGGTSSCTSPQPGSGWTCVNGAWLPPTTGGGGSTSSCPTAQPGANWTCVNGNWLPPTSGGSTGGTSACPTARPGADWTCVNGNWLPPGSGGGGSTSSCTTPQPGSNWTCSNGSWLPPGAGGGSTSSCTTPQPGSNWTCSNGNWLPPSGAGSTCSSPQPGAAWTCSNGNWLPPGVPASSSVSCPTVQPGPAWVCVNGDWRPGAP